MVNQGGQRDSDQSDDPALGLGAALDIPLGGAEVGVPRELLHVSQGPTRFHDLMGGPGDEGAPTTVGGAAAQPEVAVEAGISILIPSISS